MKFKSLSSFIVFSTSFFCYTFPMEQQKAANKNLMHVEKSTSDEIQLSDVLRARHSSGINVSLCNNLESPNNIEPLCICGWPFISNVKMQDSWFDKHPEERIAYDNAQKAFETPSDVIDLSKFNKKETFWIKMENKDRQHMNWVDEVCFKEKPKYAVKKLVNSYKQKDIQSTCLCGLPDSSKQSDAKCAVENLKSICICGLPLNAGIHAKDCIKKKNTNKRCAVE